LLDNSTVERSYSVKPAAKKSRIWWSVHQWVGLKLSILMSFVLLTGTVAVFSNEIDWLINAQMRVDPSTVTGTPNWTAMAESIAQNMPDGEITYLFAPIDRGFAARAFVKMPDEQFRYAHTHPSTGEFQGQMGWLTVQRVFRSMHRHLFLPNKLGIPIVSSLSVLLGISLVTSFVIYKRWWRGFLRLPRLKDARTFMGDFHRLAGVWSLWFVCLMTLTGFWYLVESTLGRAPDVERVELEGVEMTSQQLASALASSLASARGAYPNLQIKLVIFPNAKSGAFAFQGQDEAILVRPRANSVWTDARTSEVVLVSKADTLSAHQRIAEMADPLHFGTFGGVWTKTIWFVFGLFLTALSITGAAIYSLRLLRSQHNRPTAAAIFHQLSAGMGLWKWPATGLVVTGIVVLVVLMFR